MSRSEREQDPFALGPVARLRSAGQKALVAWLLLLVLQAGAILLGLALVAEEMRSALVASGLRAGTAASLVAAASLEIAALVLVAHLVGAAIAAAFSRALILYRTRALSRALLRIAEGDFGPHLPIAPEHELGVVRDAFERMRTALDAARSRLAHQDAQRRRLFADLAHDLATPVATVMSLADTLESPELVRTDEERARMLHLLSREVDRLARLVDDLRELASLDDPAVRIAPRAQDLAALVREVLEPLSATGHPIDASLEPVVVELDAARLGRVLQNLISNARRHGGPDVRIEVRVVPVPHGAELVVEDDGPGVPDDALARLGQRFYRTDRARTASTGGHGLGLSIVAAIVERHGGTLAFERPGARGLRVRITWPTTIPSALEEEER